MYMYVGIRRIHELIPDQAASLGHNPKVKHETTRVVVLVQPVPISLIVPDHPPEVGARQLKVRFLFLATDDKVKIPKKS